MLTSGHPPETRTRVLPYGQSPGPLKQKVVYRGSAFCFLALQGFCANPGIPPQKPQKSDYTHLVHFLRLSSMYKVALFGGCSSRGLGGLLSKTAVSEAISGSRAVHTCCCFYCCMAGDLARADQAPLSKIHCHKREINLSEKSLQCLPCATQIHTRR